MPLTDLACARIFRCYELYEANRQELSDSCHGSACNLHHIKVLTSKIYSELGGFCLTRMMTQSTILRYFQSCVQQIPSARPCGTRILHWPHSRGFPSLCSGSTPGYSHSLPAGGVSGCSSPLKRARASRDAFCKSPLRTLFMLRPGHGVLGSEPWLPGRARERGQRCPGCRRW